MVGYAVYKKNLPGPIEVIRYDQPLSDQNLHDLVDHLIETYHANITVRLMSQAELDYYLRSNPT
jgi:hypothetical protein